MEGEEGGVEARRRMEDGGGKRGGEGEQYLADAPPGRMS